MKLRSIVVACVALSLAGCVTPAQVSEKTREAKATVAQVQNAARTICSYVPTAATIAALFNTQAGQSASAWGSAICEAVDLVAPLPGFALLNVPRDPVVNGVIIKGAFVK